MGADNFSVSSGSGQDALGLANAGGEDNLGLANASGEDNLGLANASGEDNLDKLWMTLATSGDTLDDTTPVTVNVQDTTGFPATGSAKVYRRSDAAEQVFTYTGKTDTTFTGCLIASGTFAFVTGDEVESV